MHVSIAIINLATRGYCNAGVCVCVCVCVWVRACVRACVRVGALVFLCDVCIHSGIHDGGTD